MSAPLAIVSEISRFEGQTVTLRGWLYNSSSKGKIAFLQLRDGTGIIQCVANRMEIGEELFDQLKRLGQESSFVVTGVVRTDSRSKLGYELQLTNATRKIGTQEKGKKNKSVFVCVSVLYVSIQNGEKKTNKQQSRKERRKHVP